MLDVIFNDLHPDEQIYVFQKSSPIKRLLFNSPEDVNTYAQDNIQHDLYFGVAPRKRDFYDTYTRLTCVYADIDGINDYDITEETLLDRVACFPLRPSFVVNSGHGLHVYWMLDHAIDGVKSQKICKGIMSIINSDAVHDPERILRIPDTYNHKDPRNIRKVKLVENSPTRIYDSDDLLNLTKVSTQCLEIIKSGSDAGFKTRSERDWFVLRNLTAAGVSDKTIRLIADQNALGERWREDNYRLLNIDLTKAKDSYAESAQKFSESNGMLFYEGAKEKHQVATFIFNPEKLLRSQDSSEDAFLGSIKTENNTWDGIILPRSAFSSLTSFMKYMTVMEWQWLGSEHETKQYLLYLMDKCKQNDVSDAISTYVVGRHKDYWVTKTLTLDAARTYEASESPYLYADRKNRRKNTVDTVPSTVYTFPDDAEYLELLKAMSSRLGLTNKSTAIIPMLGWFAAATVKELFHLAEIRFPILNIFGTMGSGKTSIINNVLMRLVGITDAHTNSSSTTRFVLRMLLSQTNALPVTFGEYRESTIDAKSDLHGLLRMLYDTGMDSRGHADQSTETYLLEAPVIVDGEDALSDPALKQRSIIINLHPEDVQEGTLHYGMYKELVEYNLADFAGYFIQHTLRYDVDDVVDIYTRAFAETQKTFPSSLPDRVRNNIAVASCGMHILNAHFQAYDVAPIAWSMEDFSECIDMVIMRLTTGSSRTLVDDFVEDVVSFVANVQNTRVPFICFYSKDTNVLWLHFTTAHQWWTKDRRIRGKGMLESQAMQSQLAERSRDTENYVVPLTLIETTPGNRLQMYGIKLQAAFKTGLNVPNCLSNETLVSKYGMTLQSSTTTSTPIATVKSLY